MNKNQNVNERKTYANKRTKNRPFGNIKVQDLSVQNIS